MGKPKCFECFVTNLFQCFNRNRRCEIGDVYTKQITPNVVKDQIKKEEKDNQETIQHDNVHEQGRDCKYQFYTQLIGTYRLFAYLNF